MTYKEQLYKNALDVIEQIYKNSQYDPNEDLYRSYDIINATNSAQLESKEWLAENLSSILKNKEYLRDGEVRDVLIMGAWYGITGGFLKQYLNKEYNIWNVDFDPECQKYGQLLHKDIEACNNTTFVTEDAIEYFFDRTSAFQVLINTSCEHMEQDDIDLILASKNPNTIICFQSNNFHSQAEHITTFNNLKEFEQSLKLVKVYWSGTLKTSSCERYMVIGI
jgi:hypothetical protein